MGKRTASTNDHSHPGESFWSRRLRPLGKLAGSTAVVFLLASCGPRNAAPPPRPVRPVTVAAGVTRDVPIYLDEIGSCTAYESVLIQPQVTGPITAIHFTDGAHVKKGDLLFTIDPRPYQATLNKAKATLEQDRAKAQFSATQLERQEELAKTKVTSPQDLDAARANAQAAQAQVQADEAAVEAAQISFDYCSIASPIDGRTSKRMVDLGNVVSPATQLLLIQRQEPIYVDFTVPESVLPRVREFKQAGTLQVEASFPDDPEKKRVGKFDFLDAGVQPGAGVVRMRAIMANEDRLFWPGQFVNVRLLLDTMKGAVLIPNEAKQVGNKGSFVFIVKPDSTVEMRPVQLGQRQGDDVVVTSGVQPGEKVVIAGQVALAPGSPVAVVPAEGEPPAR